MKKENIFFIFSGKGGVGKSTITYNLAYLLKKKGHTVGILDLDLKTPSMYRLFSLSKSIKLPRIKNLKIQPAEIDGILVQSTGFINHNSGLFISDDLTEGSLYQLLHNFLDNVDYLLIDLPPSIDKIHSLICKNYKLGKFILVSTYSLLSLEDTKKAYNFIKKINMNIALMVLNMSYLPCQKCSEKNYFFDKNNINQFPALNSLQKVEIPMSKELTYLNEHSKNITDINDDNLTNSFNEIAENL